MPFLILLNPSVAVDDSNGLIFGISAARQWDLWNNFCDHSCSLWDRLVQDSWVHHSRMYFRSMVRNVNFLWESRGMNYLQDCSVAQLCPALCEPMGWEVSFVGLRLLFAGKQIIYLFWMIFNYLWWHYTCTHSVAKLCPTLFDPMDCSLPGSTDNRISQARILEWVASPGESSWPRDGIHVSYVSCMAGRFFPHWAIRKVDPMYVNIKS